MIKVQLLGSFSVSDSVSTTVITDKDIRSDMLKKLFTYMVLHRERPVTIQELSENLWVDGETDNPQGALKNLMYRMRTVLKQAFGDIQFFTTSQGSYGFNGELEISIDTEEYEKLVKSSKSSKSSKEKIKLLKKAVELYSGDFLDGSHDLSWIVTTSTYYHSMFLSAVKELSHLYIEEEKYSEAEKLINSGLKFDNVDETLHCELVRSYIRQGNLELATKSFENAREILRTALGVRDSQNLRNLQAEILKMSGANEAETLSTIHEDIVEKEEPDGAFFCGYPAFREIYRLENRKVLRLGEAEFILLLSLEMPSSDNAKMEKFILNKSMGILESCIKKSLRIGDVASKYSDSQYVILLPTCSEESTALVADRILTSFFNSCNTEGVSVRTDMEALNGIESGILRR